jgi:hypothetical protein
VRFYACIACKTSYQVVGSIEEMKNLWSIIEAGGVPSCPTPLCQGKLMRVQGHVKEFHQREIPLPTFFRGIHGFGSPDGEAASVKKFRELMTSGKIVEVHAEPVGQPERVILKRIVLEDGTRLHFDSSARGACCYYIEQPGPSCVEVVENELSNVGSAEAASEGSNTDREETGRASENANSELGDAGCAVHSSATAELSGSATVPAVPTASEVPTDPVTRTERSGSDSD